MEKFEIKSKIVQFGGKVVDFCIEIVHFGGKIGNFGQRKIEPKVLHVEKKLWKTRL